MKKLLLILTAVLSLSALGEVKPDGAILPSVCGENILEFSFIDKVCLSHEKGSNNEYLVVSLSDSNNGAGMPVVKTFLVLDTVSDYINGPTMKVQEVEAIAEAVSYTHLTLPTTPYV